MQGLAAAKARRRKRSTPRSTRRSRKRATPRNQLTAIATSDGKGSEVGIIEAAAGRGVRLVLVTPGDLEAAGPRTQSSSPRVKELFGVPSVAEAAALAAAGPEARLVVPRLSMGPATCAIAATEDGS